MKLDGTGGYSKIEVRAHPDLVRTSLRQGIVMLDNFIPFSYLKDMLEVALEACIE